MKIIQFCITKIWINLILLNKIIPLCKLTTVLFIFCIKIKKMSGQTVMKMPKKKSPKNYLFFNAKNKNKKTYVDFCGEIWPALFPPDFFLFFSLRCRQKASPFINIRAEVSNKSCSVTTFKNVWSAAFTDTGPRSWNTSRTHSYVNRSQIKPSHSAPQNQSPIKHL